MSAAKVSLVIAMVALLAAVAFFYQRMDRSRSSAASSQDIASKSIASLLSSAELFGLAEGIDEIGKGLALQQQISLLKNTLGKVATENARLKQAISELKLRKEELMVCNANLIKARKERARCDKWATDVDDEKLRKSEALKKTRLELQGEKQKSSELQTQVSKVIVNFHASLPFHVDSFCRSQASSQRPRRLLLKSRSRSKSPSQPSGRRKM